MNIYDIELLEFKKKILLELYSDMNKILLNKIKKNTKAFEELKQLLISLDREIVTIDTKINDKLQDTKEFYISLKIERGVYQTLNSLKNELDIDNMSELLRLFESYYKEECFIANLSEINPVNISKDRKLKFNRTNFYLCNCDNKDDTIVYKIEDLFIYNDIEYLDLNKFIELDKYDETFLFSSSYTLNDINEFFNIYRIEIDSLNKLFK